MAQNAEYGSVRNRTQDLQLPGSWQFIVLLQSRGHQDGVL